MTGAGWLVNGLAAVAMLAVSALGAQGRTSAVAKADPHIAELERRACGEAELLPQLAAAYLDRGQPGLAQAALDRSGAGSSTPEVLHLRGRVAIAQGELDLAEHLQELTLATCDQGAECPEWLELRAERQLEMLRAERRLTGSRGAAPLGTRPGRSEERRVVLAGL